MADNKKELKKRTEEEKIYGELPKGSKGRGMQDTFNNVKTLEAMARGDALELGSIVDIPERRRKVFQSIKQVQRDPSGTKNVYRGQGDVITSSQEKERAEKAKGKKFGGKVQKMKLGGEAKPLVGGQKKLDKNKDGKISGDDFAMMEDGGEANNKKNKSQSFNQSKGIYGIKNWKENTKNSREKLNSDRIAIGDKRNPVKALARMIDDEFEVSDPSMYDEIHIDGAVYSSKNKTPEKSYKPQNPKKVGPKKMEMGGKVEEYGHGGSVKGGGMSCRGMGAAIKGGGFKIR
jgi:hypothetical protein